MEQKTKDNAFYYEYMVQIKQSQPSSMQMQVKNNILQISDNNSLVYDENYKQTRSIFAKSNPYPYTALLTKHVRSINERPMFYFEVKLVGKIDPTR